jgi:uncharacterized protein YndB with AHSA1/START domain
MSSTDRIEKKLVLRAPRARVWRAITNVQEFNAWFGVTLEGEFEPGARMRGKITSKGYEHVTFEIAIERVERERVFSYRWHPYAIEPDVDYSAEPMTLVEFTLDDADDGTLLTIVESGFDAIPASRRAKALEMNDQGWSAQLHNIARHVGSSTT